MTLETSNNDRAVSLGDISIDEDEVDEKIRTLVSTNPDEPKIPRDHQVVTRLSRWEGGNAFDKELFNKPARGKLEEEERRQSDRGTAADHHTITFRDVAKVFVRSDSLLTVEDEDIERVKIMHDTFLESSQFSFNYNVMLGVASILAGKFHVFCKSLIHHLVIIVPKLIHRFISLLRDHSFGTWSVHLDAVSRHAVLIKSHGCLVKSHIM
jgi:hypothetical protein